MQKNSGSDSYSDSGFWEKLKNFALNAGREVIEKALLLYYTAQKHETPLWAKTVIFSALAYFISPIDSIPDTIPFAGYSDDLGVIATAIAMISLYITDDVKAKAIDRIKYFF